MTNMSNNRKISVCALTLYPYDTCPGQRFRIEQWEPFLAQEGIDIDYFSFSDEDLQSVIQKPKHYFKKSSVLTKAFARQFGNVLKAKNYDVVFIYRAAAMIGPAFLERLLKLFKRPIILDFDDAIFLTHTSDANKNFGWLKFAEKTATICRLSTSVTVGNEFLADYARKYNDNVYVVPTSIDTHQYQPRAEPSPESGERVIVGWTGSSTSQYYLESFEPVLADLRKRRDVEIRVVSNREPSFSLIPYTWRAWSPETEIEEISKLDIGIMPTPDDDWARGKCALKALQYMSLGIPAVCSDVGANREVIKHGENGFLAKTDDDWLKFLETLIDDAGLRKKFGAEARRTVVENYSMEECARMFGQIIRDAFEGKVKR